MEDVDGSEEEMSESAEETPMTEEGSPEEPSEGIRIPMSALGREVAEGETITLRVIASDENGISAEIVEAEAAPSRDGYEEPNAAFDRMASY